LNEYHKNIDKYKNRKLIYFFKTDWCFACKVVSADARANLNLIPSDVVFVELDFDTLILILKMSSVSVTR